MKQKQLAMILAATPKGEIGYKNTLPWHLKGDLARFKRLTMGQVVVMGSRTYASLPGPLEGRHVIVVSKSQEGQWATHTLSEHRKEVVWMGSSLDAAIKIANDIFHDSDTVFVAGGARLYEEALKRKPIIYLTTVHKAPSCPYYDTVIDGFNLHDFSHNGDVEPMYESGANGVLRVSHFWITYVPKT